MGSVVGHGQWPGAGFDDREIRPRGEGRGVGETPMSPRSEVEEVRSGSDIDINIDIMGLAQLEGEIASSTL